MGRKGHGDGAKVRLALLAITALAVGIALPGAPLRADTPPYKRACQAGFRNVRSLTAHLASAKYDESSTPRLINDNVGALVACSGSAGAKHLSLTVWLACGDYSVPGCARPMKAFLNGKRVPLP